MVYPKRFNSQPLVPVIVTFEIGSMQVSSEEDHTRFRWALTMNVLRRREFGYREKNDTQGGCLERMEAGTEGIHPGGILS